jgi:hypothetical protein
VVESAKAFVADVVHDDWLQRESGDALWQSVQHAVVPGLMRYACICRAIIMWGTNRNETYVVDHVNANNIYIYI